MTLSKIVDPISGSTEKPKPANILHSSNSVEWYTPSVYADIARKVMGSIDLDPASSCEANLNIKAERYYTREMDGLSLGWHGNVWLNPPYGQGMINWVTKTFAEYDNQNIDQIILLVKPSVSTKWFAMLSRRCVRCETDQRIQFLDGHGKAKGNCPAHGNVFFGLGVDPDPFASHFSQIGTVSIPFFGYNK